MRSEFTVSCRKRFSARRVRRGGLSLALLLFGAVLASAAAAGERSVGPRAASFVAPGGAGITREKAVGQVRRLFDGRILSATAVERDGRHGFRVRLLTDGGRVRNVYVDASGVAPEG